MTPSVTPAVTFKARAIFAAILLVSITAGGLYLAYPPVAVRPAPPQPWMWAFAPAGFIVLDWMAMEALGLRMCNIQADNRALTRFITIGCAVYLLVAQASALATHYGLGGDLIQRLGLVFYGVMMATFGNRFAKLITPYRGDKPEPFDVLKHYRVMGRGWFGFGVASGLCALLPVPLGSKAVGVMALGMITWTAIQHLTLRRRPPMQPAG